MRVRREDPAHFRLFTEFGIEAAPGVEQPDKGIIELDGKPIQVRSPQHSQELGISTVYQEVNLCTNISVAENIMLGREPRQPLVEPVDQLQAR